MVKISKEQFDVLNRKIANSSLDRKIKHQLRFELDSLDFERVIDCVFSILREQEEREIELRSNYDYIPC